MRVADYIFKTLADWGIKHVFLVTGGGAMFLNDALRLEKRLRPVCCHHEQGAAIAAEGYFRATGKIPAVSVTTGPGGTNTLTGVIGQWLDSIPAFYLSGQVKFATCTASQPELNLRQLGDQEIDIVKLVSPVTKYAKMVTDPTQIRIEMEKARFHAFSGRPGPVWLDIPINVQNTEIDPGALPGFIEPPPECSAPAQAELEKLMECLGRSKRPVLIAGHGIALAESRDRFQKQAEVLGIPVVTTFNGSDLISDNFPLYSGRIGTVGQRAGNFVLQNADLVISAGSRNNIRQVGYNWEFYARSAVKVAIDIDAAELGKKTFVPDLAIHADIARTLEALAGRVAATGTPGAWQTWRTWCAERRKRFPESTPEQREWQSFVNPYHLVRELTRLAEADTDFVAGNGIACVALFQTGIIKPGRRMFWNGGCASMGYGLPAAMGACIGSGRTTVCLTGDGSIMMNLQELSTVAHHRLPLKIFVLDNNGYGSIKQTQHNFFGPELIGCDPDSGVSFPDFEKLAEAFDLPFVRLESQNGLSKKLAECLAMPGPLLCLVKLPDDFPFCPKVSSKKQSDGQLVSMPLEDMYPFLDRAVFYENMVVDPLPVSRGDRR